MSHINKLESLQSKILRTIVNTSWYVRNKDIRKHLKMPTAKSADTQKIQGKNEKTSKLVFFYLFIEIHNLSNLDIW